jgi:hypothetical protein
MRNFALGIAGGLAAVGTAMLAMTRRSMENADQLAKQARQIGLATDRLQAMQLVAAEAGVSTQSLTNTLGIMQRNIVELQRGTAGQTRAFEALGLSIANLQGLNADQQFEQIANALNNVQDPAQRTALAMEVFGRSGREVINMLDGYSDKLADATEFQRRFGIAISQTDAEAIERANDAVGRLREAFGGLGNIMASRFAPAIERTSNLLLELAGRIADRVNPPTDRFSFILEGLPSRMDAAASAEPGISQALHNIGAAAKGAANELSVLDAWLQSAAERGVQTGMTDLVAPGGGMVSPGGLPSLEDFLSSPLNPEPGAVRVNPASGASVRPRAAPSMIGEPLAVPSIGGGAAVADQFERRLEALQQGLQTEAETIDAWYQESMAILDEGLDRRLMTEQEYLEARERLEQEYARRSNQIEAMRNRNNFQEAVNGMSQILNAVGQGNERMMRIAKAFNAAMAWIDTLAGAARELRKGTFGFASAAAVIARGVGFVNAIRSTSSSSGAGSFSSGSFSSGSSASGMAQSAQAPTTTFRFTIQNDPLGFGEQFARQMIEQLNQASANGGQIRGVLG